MRQGLSFLCLVLTVDLVASIKPVFKTPRIRVKIGENLSKVPIGGIDIENTFFARNKVKKYSGQRIINFNCISASENMGEEKPILLASLTSPSRLISFRENHYKGMMHLLSSPDRKKCDVVYETDLEDYIDILLSKEMNGSWNVEALKAQAVAARSYAFYKIRTRLRKREKGAFYDLENSERHQVNGHLLDSTLKTSKAALETRGEILTTKKKRLIPGFYHAQCGGHTLLPENVWKNKIEGYTSVRCPYCRHAGKHYWQKKISAGHMGAFMEWLGRRKQIGPGKKREGIRIRPDSIGRPQLVIFRGDRMIRVSKTLLYRYFDRGKIPSNHFTLEKKGRQYLARGRGNGHGVGMCQLGALVLAKRGWDYKRILSHYYPHHLLKKIY